MNSARRFRFVLVLLLLCLCFYTAASEGLDTVEAVRAAEQELADSAEQEPEFWLNIGIAYISANSQEDALRIIGMLEEMEDASVYAAFLGAVYAVSMEGDPVRSLALFRQARDGGMAHPRLDFFIEQLELSLQKEALWNPAAVSDEMRWIALGLILIASVILHEVMHGYVAFHLGDDTAYRAGRITANPVPHIDLFGTIIIPFFLIMSGSQAVIGWAKPVPVNTAALRHGRLGALLVSLAGPFSNFMLFWFFWAAFRLGADSGDLFRFFTYHGMLLNFVLFIFNMLPLPPLDGSAMVVFFLPEKAARHFRRIGVFGILLVFLLLQIPAVSVFFGRAWNAVLSAIILRSGG